jgi:hypothetical protein
MYFDKHCTHTYLMYNTFNILYIRKDTVSRKACRHCFLLFVTNVM